MHFFARKKEIEAINLKNKIMLKQLRDTKPSIKRDEWAQHTKKYEQLKAQLHSSRMRHKSPGGNGGSVNTSVLLPMM